MVDVMSFSWPEQYVTVSVLACHAASQFALKKLIAYERMTATDGFSSFPNTMQRAAIFASQYASTV